MFIGHVITIYLIIYILSILFFWLKKVLKR